MDHLTFKELHQDDRSHTVIFGFGPQPMDWLGRCSKICGKGAVLDQDTARIAGATFAVGHPDALTAMRKRMLPGAIAATAVENPGQSENAVLWLAGGHRGISSNTMFTHLTGVDARGGWENDHPHDVADFRRCRLLLEQVPELAPHLHKMATLSNGWAALVENWPAICASMDAEMPDWRKPGPGGKAPKTYALIKAAIGRQPTSKTA